jgi:hypothetical protein
LPIAEDLHFDCALWFRAGDPLGHGVPIVTLLSAGIGGPIGIGLVPIGSIGIAPEPWWGRQHAGPRLILLSLILLRLILLRLILLGLALPRLILLVLRLSCRRTGAGGLRRPANILTTG